MQIDGCQNWGSRQEFTTKKGSWRGIAFAPNSEEAFVEVNGYTLQAGRVLALRAEKYTVKKVRPISTDLFADTVVAKQIGDNGLQRCELQLFECEEELSAGPHSRANMTYGAFINGSVAEAFIFGDQQVGAFQQIGQIIVPFVGRRQARFSVSGAGGANTTDFNVYGVRYAPQNKDYRRTLLQNIPAVVMSNGTGVETSFYIGGTDNGEYWDFLQLSILNSTNVAAFVFAEVEVSGEIGTR